MLRLRHSKFWVFFLIFLLYPIFKKSDRTKAPWYDWDLTLLGLATVGYIVFNYTAIVTERGGIPNTTDLIFVVLTVVLIFEATRRVTGFILPILALLFLIYPFISSLDFMPNLLYTRPFDFADVFGHLYTKTEGLYSTAIAASANFIFLFILFDAVIMQVHFRAGRNNLTGISKAVLPQVSTVLKERGHLLLPIVALIYMLYLNLPIGRAAISLIIPETITDIIGLAIVIVIFALNIIKSRKKVSPA